MTLHPFTPFLLVLATALLAVLLPAPWGPVVLALVVVVVALVLGAFRQVGAALLLTLPLWIFLLILHGAMRGGEGWLAAVAQGSRLTAIILASLLAYRAFQPARFLDAAASRGWSSSAALLVLATLQAAPRLRSRVSRILEAQRSRGLRVRGRPLGRARALVPVTLPLILQTLGEVDARAMALETRGVGSARRTPLEIIRMRGLDWFLLLLALGATLSALTWRVLR
ncbi:MAG TPA: energy-coupling factor transporter transmembrane component T [Gemmatimonadales bacterium]|jgi:energy-coupling factor transport system permease protein|nr:energy-coupling factor transporter transmembrane component T [Gemmatimonadales bacterium]